jgi:hypothetical protein
MKPSQAEAPQDQAGDDRDGEPGDEVERRDAPAEEAEEQHQGHLVHHRRRDQEGEGHAEGMPASTKAMKSGTAEHEQKG